jgi:peptidoglycan hydrolase-like protein with peptidoglycan-binding domain
MIGIARKSALNDSITHTDRIVALVWADASAAELQSRLFDLGYYDGRVDGYPRPDTFDALAKFQQERGLPATGYPDTRSVQLLRESYCF